MSVIKLVWRLFRNREEIYEAWSALLCIGVEAVDLADKFKDKRQHGLTREESLELLDEITDVSDAIVDFIGETKDVINLL